MKSRAMAGGAVLVLFGTLVVCAGEFWEKKTYSSWSAREVEKALNDSPWAKTVKFRISEKGLEPFPPGPRPGMSEERVSIAGGPAVDIGPQRAPYPKKTPGETQYPLVIRWLSSRTAREAVARHWQLTDPALGAQVNQLVSAQLNYYTVALHSEPLPLSVENIRERAFLQLPLSVEKIRETAFLQLLPGHKKVLPVLVELVKIKALISPAAHVLVHFPKGVDGQPLVSPRMDAAEFQCSFDDSNRHVNVKFNLHKMVREGRPDL